MKYAICGTLLALTILGVYYSGYAIGSRDVKIECANKEKEVVIQEKEVVKYVEKKKADIYSKPNITRDGALRLFYNGEL